MATTLSGGKEFFILFDRDFKEIKRFGNHPVRGMTTEANDFMQLQGEMVSYKNSFYFASRFFGYLCRRLSVLLSYRMPWGLVVIMCPAQPVGQAWFIRYECANHTV